MQGPLTFHYRVTPVEGSSDGVTSAFTVEIFANTPMWENHVELVSSSIQRAALDAVNPGSDALRKHYVLGRVD